MRSKLTLADCLGPASRCIQLSGEDASGKHVFDPVFSNLHIDLNKPYFVAVAVTLHDTAPGGVTFYAKELSNDDEPMQVSQVPPLVFSELMRDVDLFVGVASVGNDPNWVDGGPDGRFRDYWGGYAFGDLSETAKTRAAVLATLVLMYATYHFDSNRAVALMI